MDLYSGGLFVPVKSQQSLQTLVSTEKCVWGCKTRPDKILVVLFWALAKGLSPKLEKNTEHFFPSLYFFPLFISGHYVIILHVLLQNQCIKMSIRASKALTYCSYLKVWVALQAGKVHYSHHEQLTYTSRGSSLMLMFRNVLNTAAISDQLLGCLPLFFEQVRAKLKWCLKRLLYTHCHACLYTYMSCVCVSWPCVRICAQCCRNLVVSVQPPP